MIAFHKNRPVLQVGAGFIADYGFSWLEEALESAAEAAGTTIPFKNDLIAAIGLYLEDSRDLSVLNVEELYVKIRRMLREVGLAHLAEHLHCSPPPYPVSIASIAERNPLPLFFFKELHHELAQLTELGLTNYRFTDVKQCVLAMQGRKKWGKESDRLLADIEFHLSRYRQVQAA